MEKEFDLLLEIIRKFEGFVELESSKEAGWIHFKMTNDQNLIAISNVVDEIKENHPCILLVLNSEVGTTHQLTIDGEHKKDTILLMCEKLKKIIAPQNTSLIKYNDLGIPDLSFVTIRQMATELKQRENLTFAIVWIENNERDNIAIEGSGNPTQLIGLLTRGTHMAIEWADKNINFFKPDDDA
jgi:hypothetical protein